MRYHIEHAKYKYGQLTITGWLAGDTADAKTAVWAEDFQGRRLAGEQTRTEREDVREALFPQETQCLFGFRIKFPLAAGASFFLCLQSGGRKRRVKSSAREVERRQGIPDSWKARLKEKLRGGPEKRRLEKERPERGCPEKVHSEKAGRKKIPASNAVPVKFSIVVPVYNTEPEHLADLLESVYRQSYESWELCLADASPRPLKERCRDKDDPVSRQLLHFLTGPQVKYVHLPQNLGISGNSNVALSLAAGDFIVMADHDDILTRDALERMAQLIQKRPDADFIYSDSDLTDHDNLYDYNVLRKPAWSPETLCSANYITHLSVVRANLLRKLGGWRTEYDGAQDWDLFLRIGEHSGRIYHISSVLYHWRAAAGSTARNVAEKPYARQAQLKAVQDHLTRCRMGGRPVFADEGRTCLRVERPEQTAVKDVWIRTAPGVELDAETIKELRFWASQPGIGVVCPRIVDAKGRIVSQGLLLKKEGPEPLFAGRFPGTANEWGHTDWYRNHVAAEPACYAISRAVWERVGPPDEGLGELALADFCLRAEAMGYRSLMTPFAVVRGEESAAERICRQCLAGYRKLYKKYHPEE